MNKLTILFSIISFLLIVSCEKNDDSNNNTTHPISKELIEGYVQKGPFINGTSIDIAELKSDLTQTGKTFNSQINDNKGSFEFRNVELSSQYVELKADGFYFNELSGEKSSARLTLYALSDLTDKSTLNVNILSHLEKSRVNYLVSRGGSFIEVKQQAQAEILKIFEIEKPNINESELLDISKDGDDNAILLAISIIIHGYRTVAELSELIANISTDIREDGVLDSSSIGTALINHAKLLNMSEIRENLEHRYDELGVDATIPDFEKYIKLFQDSSDFEFTSLIEYPEYSDYGENILFNGKSNFKTNYGYSLAANLPVGVRLEIILKGGMWYYQVMPNGPVNWKVSQYNFTENSQVFTAIESGKKCDLIIEFETLYTNGNDTIKSTLAVKDSIIVEFYENLMEIPTKTKVIYLE